MINKFSEINLNNSIVTATLDSNFAAVTASNNVNDESFFSG